MSKFGNTPMVHESSENVEVFVASGWQSRTSRKSSSSSDKSSSRIETDVSPSLIVHRTSTPSAGVKSNNLKKLDNRSFQITPNKH